MNNVSFFERYGSVLASVGISNPYTMTNKPALGSMGAWTSRTSVGIPSWTGSTTSRSPMYSITRPSANTSLGQSPGVMVANISGIRAPQKNADWFSGNGNSRTFGDGTPFSPTGVTTNSYQFNAARGRQSTPSGARYSVDSSGVTKTHSFSQPSNAFFSSPGNAPTRVGTAPRTKLEGINNLFGFDPLNLYRRDLGGNFHLASKIPESAYGRDEIPSGASLANTSFRFNTSGGGAVSWRGGGMSF
jgi:hypothetical protein